MPVIKHIPGHGRADVDSHKALPSVDADLESLTNIDFAPFGNLCAMPWAMTAHVLYKALDEEKPATMSASVINMIRSQIGFDGVLLSDDLSMQALEGSFKYKTAGALAAGCDVALHCNGELMEMFQVASGCTPLTSQAAARIEKGEALRLESKAALDEVYSDAVLRLQAMMS